MLLVLFFAVTFWDQSAWKRQISGWKSYWKKPTSAVHTVGNQTPNSKKISSCWLWQFKSCPCPVRRLQFWCKERNHSNLSASNTFFNQVTRITGKYNSSKLWASQLSFPGFAFPAAIPGLMGIQKKSLHWPYNFASSTSFWLLCLTFSTSAKARLYLS